MGLALSFLQIFLNVKGWTGPCCPWIRRSERANDCRIGLLIGIGGGGPAGGSFGGGGCTDIGGSAVPECLGYTLVIVVAVEYWDATELASSSSS